MKKITMLAGASLLAIAGSAFAEQSLTDTQMDGVSAGAVVLLQGVAVGNSYGNVVANLLGTTSTNTAALADPTGALSGTPGFGVAIGYADSTSIGTSVTDGVGIGGVQAGSASEAASAIF